ncbi:hypothetical protein C8J56DRAFT_1051864 [Mycena floridula]|nr:hypothetical protein C8J56DRAFT_1051864 [Mycena floridula]
MASLAPSTVLDVASDTFLTQVQWFRKGRCTTTVEKAIATNPTVLSVPDAVLCVTGEVSRESMFMGMTGNVVSLEKKVRSMDKAKYTFQLAVGGTQLQQDGFNSAYENTLKFQSRTAKSDIHEDHLVDGRMRFVQNVFSPLAGAPLDAPMQTWTGPQRVQHAVDALKPTHRVHPLIVYDVDGTLIRPVHIRDSIEGRMVEVKYKLKHWYIDNSKTQKDSFSAEIVSIKILRDEVPVSDGSSSTMSSGNDVGPGQEKTGVDAEEGAENVEEEHEPGASNAPGKRKGIPTERNDKPAKRTR